MEPLKLERPDSPLVRRVMQMREAARDRAKLRQENKSLPEYEKTRNENRRGEITTLGLSPNEPKLLPQSKQENRNYREFARQQAKREADRRKAQAEPEIQQVLEEDCSVPPKYSWATLAAIKARGLPTRESMWVDNWVTVHGYAHRLEENIQNGHGLMMVGASGQLKTTMAAAIIRANYEAGRSGYFADMLNLVDTLWMLMKVDRAELVELDRRLRNVSLLVLDDMGAEAKGESWLINKVNAIIAHRYSHNKSTIITSNLTPEEFTRTYTSRVMDRLRENSRFLSFVGASFRKQL